MMNLLKDLLDEAGVDYEEFLFDSIADLGANPFVSCDRSYVTASERKSWLS